MFSENKSNHPPRDGGSPAHDKNEIVDEKGQKKADVTDSTNVTEPHDHDGQAKLFKKEDGRPDPESPERDQRGDNKANTETDATGKTRAQAARSVTPDERAVAGHEALQLPLLDPNAAAQRGKDRAALERQERTQGTLHAMEHITDSDLESAIHKVVDNMRRHPTHRFRAGTLGSLADDSGTAPAPPEKK